MWGYRKPRRSGYGMNLAKMLNCLVFFLLMALISSAGIPTMLMSNQQSVNQVKVSHANTQFAKASPRHSNGQIRPIQYVSTNPVGKGQKSETKDSHKALEI